MAPPRRAENAYNLRGTHNHPTNVDVPQEQVNILEDLDDQFLEHPGEEGVGEYDPPHFVTREKFDTLAQQLVVLTELLQQRPPMAPTAPVPPPVDIRKVPQRSNRSRRAVPVISSYSYHPASSHYRRTWGVEIVFKEQLQQKCSPLARTPPLSLNESWYMIG
ncbi:hypothetical protein NE237_025546 [Protea cynaroides]|uniref:Uncharacterized protein n=1 Tax=Protea cynaroides TaxID=273540 RepID=A0A9Q0H5E2_9MAGN|nr:hypothetical protein NE237_025546 [Protea cynaroides]